MQKKNIIVFLSVFIAVSFILFIVITQILGVPLWWIFRLFPLSGTQLQPKLIVKVSPETPLIIGENITVTVTNSSSQLSVEDAEVTVQKDGMEVTLHTDSNGQAVFEYFGEVTVVTAQKVGFESSMPIAIPKEPEIWIREALVSLLGSGVLSGIASGFITYKLGKRKITRKKTSRKSEKKTV